MPSCRRELKKVLTPVLFSEFRGLIEKLLPEQQAAVLAAPNAAKGLEEERQEAGVQRIQRTLSEAKDEWTVKLKTSEVQSFGRE